MDEKKKKIEAFSHSVGEFTHQAIKISGDAAGLLAMKLGKESLAYKTIRTMRKTGEDCGNAVEKFLDDNIQKVRVRIEEQDLQELKDKAGEVMDDLVEGVKKIDVTKIVEQIREKADTIVTKETRVYGDPSHFYKEEDQVESETSGIILEEVTWTDDSEK